MPNIPDTRTEKQIQAAILAELARRNIPHTVSDVGLMRNKAGVFKFKRGTQGWPDISAVLPDGKFFGIEVKSAKGEVSTRQKAVHVRLEAYGAIVLVVRSAYEVYEFLEAYGK